MTWEPTPDEFTAPRDVYLDLLSALDVALIDAHHGALHSQRGYSASSQDCQHVDCVRRRSALRAGRDLLPPGNPLRYDDEQPRLHLDAADVELVAGDTVAHALTEGGFHQCTVEGFDSKGRRAHRQPLLRPLGVPATSSPSSSQQDPPTTTPRPRRGARDTINTAKDWSSESPPQAGSVPGSPAASEPRGVSRDRRTDRSDPPTPATVGSISPRPRLAASPPPPSVRPPAAHVAHSDEGDGRSRSMATPNRTTGGEAAELDTPIVPTPEREP